MGMLGIGSDLPVRTGSHPYRAVPQSQILLNPKRVWGSLEPALTFPSKRDAIPIELYPKVRFC